MSDARGRVYRGSENPLELTFWLGEVDPRPGALFRVALGLTVLHYLANLSVDVSNFWSDAGILPRHTPGVSFMPGLFDLVGSPWAVGALYSAGVVAVVAFTLGYRTRVATVASWIFITSLHRRNPYINDGGDELVRNLLFLAMFTDLGKAYSLDVALGRKRIGPVSALGVRFAGLHSAILYLLTGFIKARSGWLTGNPIFAGAQLTGFLRPPGALLLQYPALSRASTLITLVFELAFAFMAFSPVRVPLSRALAIVASLAVQLGILITMRVGVFTEAMIAILFVLVQPQWLDWLATRWRWAGRATAAALQNVNPDSGPSSPVRSGSLLPTVSFVFLAAHSLALLGWGPLSGHVPSPTWLDAERHLLSLSQSASLFTDNDPIPRWESPGVTVKGDTVNVLMATEPGVVALEPEWRMSRWYKLNFHTRNQGFPFEGIGRFLCREYKERTGVQLRSLAIIETHTPPRLPYQPAQPATRRQSLQMTCPNLNPA